MVSSCSIAQGGIGLLATQLRGDEWVISQINDAQLVNSGFGRDEVLGTDMVAYFSRRASDAPIVTTALARIAQGKSAQFANWASHKDGTPQAVRVLLSAIFDEDGTVIGCTCATSIIDQDDPGLPALGISNMMHSAEHMNGTGSWHYTAEHGRLTISDNVYAIFGFKKGTDPKTQFETIFPENTRNGILELNRKCLLDGETFDFEYRFIQKNGLEHHGTVSGQPQYDTTGKIVGIIGAIRDLTAQANIHVEHNLFLRAAKLGSIRVDEKNNMLTLAPETARLLGYPGKTMQISISDWRDLIHQDDLEQANASYQENLHKNISTARTYRIRHQDGAWRWFEFRSHTRLDPAGEPLIIYTTMMDVDDQHRAQQKLVQSEQRFLDVLSQSKEVIFEVDHQGQITYISDMGPNLFGYSHDELLTMNVQELYPDDDPYMEDWDENKETPGLIDVERIVQTKDGTIVHMNIQSVPVFDQNGNIIGYRGAARDITQQKQIQAELKVNEDRFKEVMRNARVCVYEIDANGHFTYISDTALDLFGYSHDELIGKPAYILSNTHKNHHKDWIKHLHLSDDFTLEDQPLIKKNSSKDHWVRVTGRAIRDENNTITGFRGAIFDVTEKKQAETEVLLAKETAEIAAEERARFLNTMSHEIRTPLNAVIGMTDLLLVSQQTKEQEKLTRSANMAGHHLLNLVNDILDHSKLDAGKVILEEIPFDLRHEIRNVHDMLGSVAAKNNVEFSTQIDHDLADYYLGDPARIRQILLNLAGNAIKFSENGTVCICVNSAKNGSIHFEIQDNGIGISKQAQEHLFKEFLQADASTTRKHGGTGLGLAISKRLTEVMRGQIGVISKLGDGAIFWFELPLPIATDDAPRADQESEMIDAQPKKTQFKVLIAEDNPANQFLMRTLFENLEQDITIVENGQLAVEAMAVNHFDLVFMDMQMPVMDGFNATKAIRAQGNTTPIIALTANVLKTEEPKFKAAGMNDWLPKPFDVANLVQKLNYWGNYTQKDDAANAQKQAS